MSPTEPFDLIDPPVVAPAKGGARAIVDQVRIWRRERRLFLPLFLFVATCFSTFWVGFSVSSPPSLGEGALYSFGVMTILICHEAGHFIQTRRYRVPASLPYFIPMPFTPIGTMGAVIGMHSRVENRRAVFDIGITGPLAGLVPTMLFCVIGLMLSKPISPSDVPPEGPIVHAPRLFEWIMHAVGLEGSVSLHPLAFAGWVGLLVTSLNLIPIGQLDGGHILYGLLRWRAGIVAWAILFACMAVITVAVVHFHQIEVMGWMVLILLLILIGPRHPPACEESMPLGFVRTVLGWATLAIVPIGFTPIPFAY